MSVWLLFKLTVNFLISGSIILPLFGDVMEDKKTEALSTKKISEVKKSVKDQKIVKKEIDTNKQASWIEIINVQKGLKPDGTKR